MKTQVSILNVLICLLICTETFSQSGESKFKKVTINSQGKLITDILPLYNLNLLSFTEQNNNQQIDGKEEGELKFYIINTGLNELEELTVSITDINKTQGLKYGNTYFVRAIRVGDSVLVTIPIAANDSLKNGSALFNINVADKNSIVNKTAQITIPTKESSIIPVFSWIIPNSALEKTEFPVYEISGMLKSEIRITRLNLYVNGMISTDKNTFLVLPTENPDEYLIKRTLALEEGYNEIRVEAQNSMGVSLSETRVINYSVQKIDQIYREKRIALVIGNADYVNGNNLANPVNDAIAFSAALKELGFNVLTFLNADQKTLKKAMDEFGERLRDFNVSLFYYAGHGLQVNGINYLIPVDANLRIAQDVDYDCVDVGRLLGKMEAAGTATNIVILDACRDNPFERAWSARSGGKGNGLAFMNAPSGSIIAYATSPGKTASDGTGKNGLYTEALLQFINVPGLPIEEFFKNVRRVVEIKSNKAQTPWESTSLKGTFYFRIKK